MLSLDSVKTRTIYSKQEIYALYIEFKGKLNQAYDLQDDQAINNLLLNIRALYYLSGIPCFLKQFNQVGQIQLLALLQVLFMKSSHWKSHKQVIQKWVSILMRQIGKFVPSYTIKPQISTVNFEPEKQQIDINFFSFYLQKISKIKSQASMFVAISFLRVFLIDQLQNKRRQFTLIANNQLLPQWRSINESLLKMSHDLQNLKYQQICVSICYWLCSQNNQFIKQCVLKGAVAFLCQTLSNKSISEWYGRKILSFLKLLLLGFEGKNQSFETSDIQSSIAQFTLKYDNQTIMEQARSLFSCMNTGQGKVQRQIQSYEKYAAQKNPKNLQNVIKNMRVLLLYSQDQKVRKQINELHNLQYIHKLIKKQENIYLLSQILNIVAYNNNKNKNDRQNEIDFHSIERVSNLLSSSKDKNQLLSNNKKILITLIRMLKQFAQSRQYSQKLLEKIKSQSIVKKLSKFSDCMNFRYERQLLSLIRLLNSSQKNKSDKEKQSSDIMKALLKHMNQNVKKVGKKLQDQLEQLQLIFQMLQRGETEIKPQVIASIFQKIKIKKNQTQQVQITILDQSQSQRNRQIINRINYLAISCLQKLQKNQKIKNAQIKEEDLDKIVNIGLNTQDLQTIKVDTSYLIALSNHGKLNDNAKQKVAEVYSRYKQLLGQDSQLKFGGTKQNTQQLQQKKFKEGVKLIQKSFKQQLQNEELKLLQTLLLNQQQIKLLQKWVEKYQKIKEDLPQSSFTLFLKFLLKLSQINEKKKYIFNKFYKLLSQNLQKSSDINNSLIFKIFSELIEDNFEGQQSFFQQQLTKSYEFLSKDSIQFTNNCLYKLQYKGSAARQENYWKYIYNAPEMIGREAAFMMMNQADSQKSQKFWSFFTKPILKNIEEQKKLTLHFLQIIGNRINKQIWQKFQLNNLLQKLMQILKLRNSELQNKIPTQVLLRKLLRLSKSIKSVVDNQNIEIWILIPLLYSDVTNYLLTFPKNTGNSQKKMHILSQEYLKSLVQILKCIFKRKQGFSVVKKQLHIFQKVCQNILGYKESLINDKVIEGFRVLFLRDDKHEQFQHILKIWNQKKINLISLMSQAGKSHNDACERIIEAVIKKNQIHFKKQFLLYFFPQRNKNLSKTSNDAFNDQQLLKALKNLLNPPYQFGLNTLQKHLRLVQSSQFSNVLTQVFVSSAKLVEQDKENKTKSLEQVQKTITDNIWGLGCQLNSDFYNMINMNLIGLRVCLKTKGIGQQGTTIVCQKFYQHPDDISLCAQILYINVTTLKQWNILQQKKIPQLINTIYKSKGRQQKYGISLANLIGSSSKLKAIQNQYKIQNQLFQNLQIYAKNSTCIAATLYAISGLVYLNQANQKILSTKQRIRYYVKIIQDNSANSLIFDRGCNLLSNMVYKNQSLIKIYIQLTVQTIVIKIASSLLYEYSTYKQFLRLIGNLSLSLQAVHCIIKTQFLYLWSNIFKQAQINKHDDIIKYCFDIIYNLVNYHQIQAKIITYKVHQANCVVKIIQYLQRNSLVSNIVQAGLDAIQKLLILDVTRRQAIQHDILKCLQDIAKTQSWNQNILQKWIKLLYTLTKDHQAVKNQMLQSQIFGRLAIFIKQHPQIKQQYLNIVINITDFVYQKADHKLFIPCGFIDLLVELLKNKYLKSISASTIIQYFNNLHAEKVLNSIAYTKIFSGLMCRLQIQFRDEGYKKIISSITKIREHIIINTRAATILLQFAYIFLTQSQIITSPKYHKRVRQFICLLSYFVAFSIQLKIIFREQNFIQILNSWIKIDKTLQEDNSVAQACRVCIFTIQNQQRFLVSTASMIQSRQYFINKLIGGTKCYLYRRDHSNKDAILKLRIQQQQLHLVSYKYPDGQIKLKYRVPLTQIIGLRAYQNSQDNLLKESVFSTPKGIFQKSAVPECCLTVIAIVGQQLSIRQIDVQFTSNEARQQFVVDLKSIVSLEFKNSDKFI